MSLKITALRTRGDTLIEVLFAVTVFSVVAVGGLGIMNQGTAAAQRSLEVSLVRNEIDAQAESLRFLNSAYISVYQYGVDSYEASSPAGQWSEVRQLVNDTDLNRFSDSTTCEPMPGSFVIDTRNAKVVSGSDFPISHPQTFSQLRYSDSDYTQLESVEGIWIEAISSSGGDPHGYIDFHIRACWDALGQRVPASLGTIVRLYEPR
jgi:prepilin-type N-terminal cleavage/methylation domain-containing protein